MSRNLIYRPGGRALEYAPWALNYYAGCDHGCSYCYVARIMPNFQNIWPDQVGTLKQFSINRLHGELQHSPPDGEVLLCFLGDPYCQADVRQRMTRQVLQELLEARIPVRILTKGGTQCMADKDLFLKFRDKGVPIKVGQSLTFILEDDSQQWEPGAAPPSDRLLALEMLHAEGIGTWASFEPVIDPAQSLALMEEGLLYIDEYRVGKLNHRPELEDAIDWHAFGKAAEEMLRGNGKRYMLKQDLRKAMKEARR